MLRATSRRATKGLTCITSGPGILAGVGRFTSVDPGNIGAGLGDPQSWNGYGYVNNDPMNNIDPRGLFLGVNNPHSGGEDEASFDG